MATKDVEVKITGDASQAKKEMTGFRQGMEEASKTAKALKNDFKQMVTSLIGIGKQISILTSYTDDYVTSQNVLRQTFSESTKGINDYISSLADMTGISTSDISQKSALFGQMATSLGIANEEARDFVIQLDDLSAKLAILYNKDFNKMAKAMLDAVKGESSTLATITGNILKTGGLQATLDSLGIDLVASELSGANKAMLEFITIARQVNTTNEEMGRIANDVAWQKRLLKAQVKELALALGNLLYPILRAILPVLNAIIITITTLLKLLASAFGITNEVTENIDTSAISFDNYGKSIEKASAKAKRGLRSFDKLNNITTPTPTTTSGGGGAGLNADLLKEFNNLSKDMLNIRTRAQEISDSIMKWLGFSKQLDGTWKFDHITLGTILGVLVGGGGIIWAISTIIKLFKKLANFGGLGSLLGTGKGTSSAGGGFKVPSPKTILVGLADLTLIIGGITGLVLAYGKLREIKGFDDLMASGINELVTLFTGLGKVAIQIGAFSVIIAGLGIAGLGTIVQGIGGLALVIGGITGLVTLLGALTKVEGFNELINGGIDLLVDLSLGLGRIVGALFSGLGAGLTDGLPIIGANLSAFGTLSKPFFETVKDFSSDTALGIKYLAEALFILAGENMLSVFSSIEEAITGTSVLAKFGMHLTEFAPYFVNFAEQVKDINGDHIQGIANSIFALSQIEKNLPKDDKKLKTYSGTILTRFGKQLPEFGTNLKTFGDNVAGLDSEIVKNAIDTAKVISEYEKNLPKHGGLSQLITGDNSIMKFAKQLPKFGEYLKEYADKVTGLDGGVVQNSINIAKVISEYEQTLQKHGGIVSWFKGDNKISDFGKDLAKFGGYFLTYCNYVGNIPADRINNITQSVGGLVDLAKRIKDNGLTNVLKEFGESLKSSANGFVTFFSINNAYNIGYSFGASLSKGIINAMRNSTFPSLKLKETDYPYNTFKTFKISAYAEGGFPEDGLFFANHNELIGNFENGKTAVANNEQIIKGIENGVTNGMRKALNSVNLKGNNPIYVKAQFGDDEITGWVQAKANERERQYGF